jgi:hypothetical protein
LLALQLLPLKLTLHQMIKLIFHFDFMELIPDVPINGKLF